MTTLLLFFSLNSIAYAGNSVNIEQVGTADDFTLTINQDGNNNSVDLSIAHDDNTVDINQVGNNNTVGWVSYWGSGKSWGGDLDGTNNDHDDHGGLAFDTSIAAIVASTVKYNNNRYGATRTAVLSDAVSNLTTGFAGFSDAAYSNGATATINVTGNTTTQSGLTAGTNYFVQNDGSLGTSAASAATVEAGLALSSTKLLIKG